ncbi:MAG: hypothetical protein V4488_05900 [Pseudomonadota bacterium]
MNLVLLRQLYFEAHPELQNHPERSAMLLAALQAMATDGVLKLPSPANWERIGSPVLPKWVTVIRVSTPVVTRDYAQVPWVPELGFWTELKPGQLEDAFAINAYMLRHRGTLVSVPIKERSLDIFGDEKRLDTLRSGDTLFAGRLALATMGAFVVPLPLPYRSAGVHGSPVLVVENHNSYWSFGEWNQTARRYSAVVYGAGEAFRSSGAALGEVLREVGGTGALYLGDLDPKGISIPLEFNADARNGVHVEPAMEWYQWLLRHGVPRVCSSRDDLENIASQWLGAALGQELHNLWSGGEWMPQEGLGFRYLTSITLKDSGATI